MKLKPKNITEDEIFKHLIKWLTEADGDELARIAGDVWGLVIWMSPAEDGTYDITPRIENDEILYSGEFGAFEEINE